MVRLTAFVLEPDMAKRCISTDEAPRLVRDAGILSLVSDGMRLSGDFSKLLPRVRGGRLGSELLVRAARLKGGPGHPTAVDGTAGLGEDSFLLAAAGFDVTLFERDAAIAALLADALERAAADPGLAAIASRMHLVEADAVNAMAELDFTPDLVYLDPMFPAKRGSAQAKKKLQMLQMLERPCEDEDELLEAVFAAAPAKIVVKRPVKGPYLAGRKPSHSVSGKLVRYDCYLL